MKYMGSKASHAKEILSVIFGELAATPSIWVEPFVGGCNMIDKVAPELQRFGNDINADLIEMFKAVQSGWMPPETITENEYDAIKTCPEQYPKALVAFVAIGCSYSGKWWGGYARGNTNKGLPRNYCMESRKNLLGQNLNNITFTSINYAEMTIPDNAVVYCDPPYVNTTKYKNTFNHDNFWAWCDSLVSRGVKTFVSEYTAPDGWDCIWSKQVNNTLVQNTGSKQGVEKLFTKND